MRTHQNYFTQTKRFIRRKKVDLKIQVIQFYSSVPTAQNMTVNISVFETELFFVHFFKSPKDFYLANHSWYVKSL
jgi:hypothetical protein